MAVLMALDFIPSGDTAVFFTDSKLTVGWLMKGWNCSNQITADVIEAIGEVARAKRIQMHFHRVKGHSDSHQNNMVDFEAGRQAKLANASF